MTVGVEHGRPYIDFHPRFRLSDKGHALGLAELTGWELDVNADEVLLEGRRRRMYLKPLT
ncbi:hypothetical protein FHX39_000426 [Friedmanniella antarctica]|uniref:Uncharacterized protein n=1 Tax=Microlunatus antarcticus TaxID=53388 RepID=A0A7W5JSE9_9ACTN|nr:hypothetical protein [Microlunatus antarcticus]